MKKLLLSLAFILTTGYSFAQKPTPPPVIPPYKILTIDSTYATPANLKKNKPVMIVYFSPDCSHCQHMMLEMKPKMASFKDIQIVMITFTEQIKAIQVFARDYSLKSFPNFTIGSEGRSYTVAKYYSVTSTPYVAIYDKKGKLSQAFEKAPTIEDLAKAVKKVI